MGDVLMFRRLLTPLLVQTLFWMGIGACLVWGLVISLSKPAAGVLILALGPLAVRIICELLLLGFQAREALDDIRQALRHDAPSREASPLPGQHARSPRAYRASESARSDLPSPPVRPVAPRADGPRRRAHDDSPEDELPAFVVRRLGA